MTNAVLPTVSPPADVDRPKPKRRTKVKPKRQNLAGWLFVGPVILGVLFFQLAPVAASLVVSLTNWSGLNKPTFLGLDNYKELFTADDTFWPSLKNTVIFTLAVVVLTIGIGLALAVLCNQKVKGIGIFRTLYYSPAVTNVVAIGFVWFWLYDPDNGLFNSTLKTIGIHGPAWLSDAKTALIAVIIVAIWQGVGYPMVILLAGLQSIDQSLLEAATVDGASAWRRFWSVVVPLLTPSLFFLTITQFITSFQVFGIIYVMTSGGPNNATSVFIFHIYEAAFGHGRLGYASAMGWVLFVIVGVVTAVQWRLEKRWVHYDN
ncbi:carbohydrate ABC transporter membrane protein 1 (CUT1 family) [Kribbella sp. VKM Ac-2569]|uniref:carbohydrate ABC transporter permease n=1 Tax=Kribbella sp. VKM Ac-2569 TaxID=2512220 RepID=UPI00102B8DA2|nr:sugar ABC transporter permease [Kribbella sp. VKM Ac-2569]RZT27551.1 carbohydrate ABC transporter membrane protein 1 (CUT1 family) [Kribbella sp. VKM Ac-2569]